MLARNSDIGDSTSLSSQSCGTQYPRRRLGRRSCLRHLHDQRPGGIAIWQLAGFSRGSEINTPVEHLWGTFELLGVHAQHGLSIHRLLDRG